MTIKELLEKAEELDERVVVYEEGYRHISGTVEDALDELPEKVLNFEVSSWRVTSSGKLEINHWFEE